MDQGALEELVRRVVRAEMAGTDRLATVEQVNADGTVTLDLGGGQIIPSQPALASYSPRARGHVVVIRPRSGELLVMGRAGQPTLITTPGVVTVSNTAAPGGAGWEQIQATWARGQDLYLQRTTPVTPPSGGAVSLTTTAGPSQTRLATYRSGTLYRSTYAEQGNYSGGINQQGLVTFGPSAWAALAGKTATGGTLTAHRMAVGHGNDYGPVSVYAYVASAGTPPAATPTALGSPVIFTLALNQTATVAVPAVWGQRFCSDANSAVFFSSANATDDVQIDSVTVSITY